MCLLKSLRKLSYLVIVFQVLFNKNCVNAYMREYIVGIYIFFFKNQQLLINTTSVKTTDGWFLLD